jgi:flavin-dependent dehydrogenase
MKIADLIVIGGGPAGTAAAITAAQFGARVTLVEAGRFPRHKVCGEFVSAESLELLSRLLDAQHTSLLKDAVRIGRARLFVDQRVLSTEIEPQAASIARFDLDAALWDSARQIKVEARQQIRVLEIRGGDPFVVRTSEGELEARAVVNASGRWSNLSASCENLTSTQKWIGLKAHFAETSPPPSVDLYFFPGGYCGVQPVDFGEDRSQPRVNACAMVRADVASTLAELLELHPALRERSCKWEKLSDPVSVAPLLFQVPQPVLDGVLMAGDAAGFVDPFIGDGISLALRSGALAAECLAEFLAGNISREVATRRYASEYQQSFAPIFSSSSRLRRMLLLPRAMRMAILAVLKRSPAMMSYLVKKTRQGKRPE